VLGHTPAPLLQPGPARGISRRSVIELAGEAGHLVEQGRLSVDDLRRAAEVLVTSTASGIMPVTVIDGEPVGTSAPGPLTTHLRDRCWGRHKDPLSSTPSATANKSERPAGRRRARTPSSAREDSSAGRSCCADDPRPGANVRF